MAYTPQGVNFDGTNDFLTRGADLTDNADSKLFTGSFWFSLPDTEAFPRVYRDVNGRVDLFIRDTGAIGITGRSAAGALILSVDSSAGYDDGAWHHCCFSFDMADAGNRHLFVDDASDLATVSAYTDSAIDFTNTDHAIGALVNGTQKLSGDLADLYLNFAEYVDLSVEANRRKFIGSGAATSVDLGSDGSTPTGTAPIIFLSGATATWHTNKGTGGGFTENGELTDASANPPADELPAASAAKGVADIHYSGVSRGGGLSPTKGVSA